MTQNHSMKAAVSFFHEHGIFLKKKDQLKLGISKERAVSVSLPKTLTFGYETCRDFDELELKQEAKTLLALFESVYKNHYSFLGGYGVAKLLEIGAIRPVALTEVYPELDVKSNSPFVALYRKAENVVVELDSLAAEQRPNRGLRRRIKDTIGELSEELKNFYEKAECAIGVGSYIAMNTSKPLETSFGIGELDIGTNSHVLENQTIIVNPFVLYWVINDHCKFRKGKISWTLTDFDIAPTEARYETPIRAITVKCYIPHKEMTYFGVSKDEVVDLLKRKLPALKPFILKSDLLLPFSCPSIVLELDISPKTPALEVSTYGYIPSFGDAIPKIEDIIEIDVKFFDFPRLNRKSPVVLDTSAIDISRFPLKLVGSFFTAFIENRELIIPKVVMHELKTRLRTRDSFKVEQALLRFRRLQTWGFVKNIRIEGEFPRLSLVDKKDIEDLRDCMILDVARNNNGIIFTNDKDLIKLAALFGVYTITFSGLEEDVISVIKEKNLKFTVESAIEKVIDYGRKERGEEYGTEDVRWMIEYLCRQNILRKQEIRKKEVLQFLGSSYKRV